MASDLDTALAAADIYAESLLDLANERGIAEEIFTEFESLVDTIKGDEEFAQFLASYAVDDDDRREALRKIFEGRIHELVLNTMLVLNDHGRAGIVPTVFERYKDRYDAQRNRQDVRVRSATELNDEQRERIRSLVGELTGKEAVLLEEVVPDLLGGIILQIGDRQYDGSLRSRLSGMREYVIELGRQEILSGKHDFWVEEGA